MKHIYVLDEDKEKIIYKALVQIMEKEKSIKVHNYKISEISEALVNIPDIVVVNEDNINVDMENVFKQIKSNEDNSITPIIVLSSNKEQNHIIETLKNDVEIYLTKPVNDEILYYSIMNIMKLLNRNRMVSPLTGLPGNVQIQAEMKKRLSNGKSYAMIYIDLDNFKAYNDTYGFSNGDEMIKLTARVITKNVMKNDENEQNFVGHIGGDDFVAIVEGDDYEQVCQNIIAEFDKSVEKYFSKEDVERGYIEVENRKGVMEQFPLTTISVGVVEVTPERFKNTLEIGEAGAAVKHLAKTIYGSTYVIDRRKNREEIFDKAEQREIK